jgi:hypothetical protein
MKYWAWVMVVAAGLIGCGPDCASMCEDGKDCPDANKSIDCEKTCEEAEKTAEGAGCESQYESMLDCEDDNKDEICSAGESCKKELEALATCMAK